MSVAPKVATPDDPFMYNASPAQLENQILFSAFVAGKTARIQMQKLRKFWELVHEHSDFYVRAKFGQLNPSTILSQFDRDQIRHLLEQCKVGQYTRLTNFICTVFPALKRGELDLKTCTREELCEYPGFNMKSASFFLLFTRPEAEDQIACLDTHILAYLRDTGLYPDAPKATPQKKKYLEIEQVWLKHKRSLGRNGAELDFEIWKQRSRGGSEFATFNN